MGMEMGTYGLMMPLLGTQEGLLGVPTAQHGLDFIFETF